MMNQQEASTTAAPALRRKPEPGAAADFKVGQTEDRSISHARLR